MGAIKQLQPAQRQRAASRYVRLDTYNSKRYDLPNRTSHEAENHFDALDEQLQESNPND